mgnify:CR=1 FL=1
MQKASVWVEKVMIPTYEIGEAEKNPNFSGKTCVSGKLRKGIPVSDD